MPAGAFIRSHRDTMSITIGRNLVAITNKNGGIDAPNTCWFPQVEQIDGREFIKIVPYIPQFTVFVKNDKRMYQAMCNARNDATTAAFKQFDVVDGDNPYENHVVRKGRKRQLIELIDQAIPAKVTSEDGVEHTFMCVPEHRVDSMLRVELTHENVKLLTLKPRVEPEPIRFKPDIEEEHVKWVGCRSMVTCRYFDKSKGKRRMKSFTVPPSANYADYRERINRMAQACQVYFDAHHSDPAEAESNDGEDDVPALADDEGNAAEAAPDTGSSERVLGDFDIAQQHVWEYF